MKRTTIIMIFVSLFFISYTSISQQGGKYLSIGSTKEEVLQILGTPSDIIGNMWFYRLSSITFRNDRIVGYSGGSNLKIKIFPAKKAEKNYLDLNSPKDDVLSILGTPSDIIGNMWCYRLSSITFRNDRVVGYTGGKSLKFILKPNFSGQGSRKERIGVFVGSTKNDVIFSIGTPSDIIGNMWFYRLSSITFRNDRVVGYTGGKDLGIVVRPNGRYINNAEVEAKPSYTYQGKIYWTGAEEEFYSIYKIPSYKQFIAENSSYYGEISKITGRPKTVFVRGYFRKDGTYVRSHYRSKPKRKY